MIWYESNIVWQLITISIWTSMDIYIDLSYIDMNQNIAVIDK